jgi:non-haem Fe2+, alpha-ketoglutarate-dependent halogenase
MTLSRQQLETYNSDGFVFPVRVFSGDEILYFRAALEKLLADFEVGTLKRLDGLHLFFPWAYQLVSHDALLNSIEQVLGPDILVDGTLVFYKPAHDSSYVSWHQDSVYSTWHLTPSTSAWIALTPSNPGNGCMRAIPGSHKEGLLSHTNRADKSNLLIRGEQVATGNEAKAVDIVLEPGEVSLHHSTLVHGSNANSSDQPRIGFIVRFITNQIARQERPVLRVRGNGDCSHLTIAEAPTEKDPQARLLAWRAFNNC